MPSSSAHASTVVIRREGPVAVVLANNPPVNVITAAVRRDLRDAFAQIATDPTVQSVVLACAGSTFFSGADISEFGSDPGVIEDFNATCDAIEQCEQPVLAAIQGFAFGAGLELALSCHYRLSTPTAKVGLPEVTLGVLPGAGGTQRAPRLMGAAEALKLILGGGPLSASVACQKGLIDEVVQEDLLTAAVARAAELAAQRTRLRRTSQLAVDPATVPPTLFADARDDIARRMPASFAPARIVDCVEAATRLPFAEGLAVETRLVWDCMCSPQSAALRHGFFAERELSKVPGLPKGTTARELKRVGVLGAGALGARIAGTCSMRTWPWC
jgi:3-hydroxyacyl-CoA dehydrogenase